MAQVMVQASSADAIFTAIPFVALAISMVIFALFLQDRANKFAFAKISRTSRQHQEPDFLGPYFDSEATYGLVDALSALIEKEKPNHILGVNPGGRLASVLVCEKSNYPKNKLAYVAVNPNQNSRISIKMASNRLSGKLLVIDDVTRRGTTLERISRRLTSDTISGIHSVTEAKYATLVLVSTDTKANSGYFRPDWWGAAASQQNVSLPWSKLSANATAANQAKAQNNSFDPSAIELQEELETSYDFSLYCAKLALDDPKQFNEHLASQTLFDSWESSRMAEEFAG